ncbi:hypothetical protein [Acinetobacter wuhouensis]|uniref:Uncharacterized protein n=1 Tax=Acinetobacter wuhouensis TaxID=1879050 RepID=A0A4Q7AJ45_9GAMM|nr:hypothetical protein [Acinetobacter wuhouensis]RZG43032.1 hypothetical protein EXU28_18225 [Acinetobacter wuhouensis]
MPNLDHYSEYYSPDNGPWDNPCWNDDWEIDLLAKGYKTLAQWNNLGRVVKSGKKGIYLSCARRYVFNIQETEENIRLAKFFTKKRYKLIPVDRKIDNTINKDKLILFLIRNKFEYIQTVSNVWKDAFKLSIKSNHLFILFRKNGVDIKLYDGGLGEYSIQIEKYSFQSGHKISFSYNESSISIFYFIVQLVSVFNMGGNIKFMMESIE